MLSMYSIMSGTVNSLIAQTSLRSFPPPLSTSFLSPSSHLHLLYARHCIYSRCRMSSNMSLMPPIEKKITYWQTHLRTLQYDYFLFRVRSTALSLYGVITLNAYEDGATLPPDYCERRINMQAKLSERRRHTVNLLLMYLLEMFFSKRELLLRPHSWDAA